MIITLDVGIVHFARRFRRPEQALSPWAQRRRTSLFWELRKHFGYQLRHRYLTRVRPEFRFIYQAFVELYREFGLHHRTLLCP